MQDKEEIFFGYLYEGDILAGRELLCGLSEAARFVCDTGHRRYRRIVTDGFLELKVVDIAGGEDPAPTSLCFGDAVKTKERKAFMEAVIEEKRKEQHPDEGVLFDVLDYNGEEEEDGRDFFA